MALPLADKIKPKNNGTFALVDAVDVAFREGRLPDYMPVPLTQAEYDALAASGELNENTPYLIVSDEA